MRISDWSSDVCSSDLHDAELGELVLWGQGDTHLKVVVERLRNRFKLNVETGRPAIAYRETIRRSAEQHARHKKQSGGHGQFADIKVWVEGLPRGAGFQFADTIVEIGRASCRERVCQYV